GPESTAQMAAGGQIAASQSMAPVESCRCRKLALKTASRWPGSTTERQRSSPRRFLGGNMQITGNVTTASGAPADWVRVFVWPDQELVAIAKPDEEGN